MQAQMAELFGVNPQNITMHLKSIHAERELVEDCACPPYPSKKTRRSRGTAVP
jgi:hypothetical protein